MPKLDLSAPWYIYQRKLAALFEYDDSVTVGPVVGDEGDLSVTLKVSSHAKAAALKKVLKSLIDFGNISLEIVIEDMAVEGDEANTLRDAFANNRLVYGVETRTDATGTEHHYLVMEPDVIQIYADNLADYRGNISALAEEVAREALELNDAVVCTADLCENGVFCEM